MTGPITVTGGKSRLAKQIIALFPKHTLYVEPCCGGAQVFFHKTPSKVEVLNDLDGGTINFFRVCQFHPEELIRSLRYCLSSREWFDLLLRTDPCTLTDIQRAAQYFYIRKTSFGGRVLKPTFGYRLHGRPLFRPSRIPALIEAAHQRLRDVQIECLPYQQILHRYDRTETLFYFDPPYWGLPYYNHNFSEVDFVELESHVRNLRGKFILSLNDVPEIRRLFRAFTIETVELAYSCPLNHKGRRHRELLIHNLER